MKYIRTKDSIFELVNEEIHLGKTEGIEGVEFYKAWQPERISLNGHRYTRSVEVKRVIKTADTIEELCDEFVYVASEKDRPVVCYKPTAFHKLSDNLYGAIWTDKGLIYVAKMNEEGTLELL